MPSNSESQTPDPPRSLIRSALLALVSLSMACASTPSTSPRHSAHDPARAEAFEAWSLGYRLLQLATERGSLDLARAGLALVAPYTEGVPLEVEAHARLPFEPRGGAEFLANPHAVLRDLDPNTPSSPAPIPTPTPTNPRPTPPHHLARLDRDGRLYATLPAQAPGQTLSVMLIGERHSRWSLWLYDADGQLLCADRRRDAIARCEVHSNREPAGLGPLDLVVVHESERPMSVLLFGHFSD